MKGKSDMVRRTVILELPRTLIINIRRFKESYTGVTKDNTHLQFPLRLCMDQYSAKKIPKDENMRKTYHNQWKTDEARPENVYELYAVITHSGSIHSGHYFCFVSYSTGIGKKW